MPGSLLPRIWEHDPAANAPAKYRRACRYEAYLPVPLGELPILLDGPLSGLVSEAQARIQALNAVAHPGLAPMARLLLRTEAIASSKVEGMSVGIRELARSEAKQEQGEKIGSGSNEVLANIDAMDLAIHEAADAPEFGVAQIVAIHRKLLEHTSKAYMAGQIRTRQNWIGGNDHNPCGSDFVPPPPEFVVPLLDDLSAAINDDLLPPLIQAALVHAQFETIHPFEDGNGRTGRALIHAILRRRGLTPAYLPPISVLFARDRNRYVAGLTAFRADDVNAWIEQFAAVAARAASLAATYLRAVEELQQEWKTQLAESAAPPRADAAAWELIRVLPACPSLTGPMAMARTGRSKPQTYLAIDKLMEVGALIPLSDAKRRRCWEPRGLLDLMARLEAGDVPD